MRWWTTSTPPSPLTSAFTKRTSRAAMAHAAMLAKQGIITDEDNEAIQKGLAQIHSGDIEKGEMEFKLDQRRHPHEHRIPADRAASARPASACTPAAPGMTRWHWTSAFMSAGTSPPSSPSCSSWRRSICQKAKQHKDTVMPGYTHLQRAQPISFAQHLLAYAGHAETGRDPAGGLP